MSKKTTEKYIVVSKDDKWFFTGNSYFSDKEDHAISVTKKDAEELVSSITVMELELRKVA